MIGRSTLFRTAKWTTAFAGMFVLLSGCARDPWEADIDPTAYACSQYGFYPGTKEWDDCLKFVEARRGKRFTP
jgi:hypothetical protein